MGIVGLFSFSGHGIYEYLLWLLNVGSTLTMRSLLCFQRAGDRSWKTVWAVVQGHALIFYKDRQHALQVTYSTPFKVLIFLNLFCTIDHTPITSPIRSRPFPSSAFTEDYFCGSHHRPGRPTSSTVILGRIKETIIRAILLTCDVLVAVSAKQLLNKTNTQHGDAIAFF